MTVRGVLVHVAICALCTCGLLAVPALATGSLGALLAGQSPDVITAATTTLAQPTGTYSVYINAGLHDAESLETWATFFTHYEDFTYSMENVACAVPRGDAGAQDMAASYQSQLPENQMQLTIDDPTVLLSRMQYGKYDMVIMSQEFIDSYGPVDAGGECLVLEVSGGGQS